MIQDNQIEIASYEADIILVNKGVHGHSDGRIFYLDISTGFFPPAFQIADSLEELIIYMANFHKLSLEGKKDKHGSTIDLQDKFKNILKKLNSHISDKVLKNWEYIVYD